MSGVERFGARIARAVSECGPIVAGIDPHAGILDAWGLPHTADGAERLGRTMVEASAGKVAALKPQSAFFERFGGRGVVALERVLEAAREAKILTILDVKRGDIGSTMGAYAESTLAAGAPLEADAITVSPFLGFGSLRPCLDYVTHGGKGLFVLALTSNPEGQEVQHARDAGGESVAASIARRAGVVNEECARGAGELAAWGSVGLVVGATVGDAAVRAGVDLAGFSGPILAPGFGAQGAGPSELRAVFGEASSRVLVSMSRSVLAHGPRPREISGALDRLRAAYT